MDVMAINPSCGQMKGRTHSEVHGAHLVNIFAVHPFDAVDSLKLKVAQVCKHPKYLTEPFTLSNVGDGGENLNLISDLNKFEDYTMAQRGFIYGSELTVILAQNHFPSN